MGHVGVRTAAGGVLSLEVTPADVIGRCDPCRRRYREGDMYCEHLAGAHGHPIARLTDQPDHAEPRAGGPAPAPAASRYAPVFLAPLAALATPA